MADINKEEVEQIAAEIEADEELEPEENELSEEELEELEEEEDIEEDLEDDSEEDFEASIVKNYTIIQQPITTFVEVGAETGAKGEVKPFVTVKITRNLEETEVEDAIDFIADDFAALSDLVENEINGLKTRLNKNKPEMQ